ncbi:hypothetical protein LP420_14740 [Massilia sp. B-10]|nr:hypothetical protein LP420_14740 [Massilia sp. B-10]
MQHYSNDFTIYTYAFDVSGISSATVKIRAHTSNSINGNDDTYKVYDPAAMAGKSGLSVTPSNVGAWTSYPMQVRDLQADMNGVAWAASTRDTLALLLKRRKAETSTLPTCRTTATSCSTTTSN